MEENKIELNRKHVGLRIIVFVIAISLAGVFISLAVVFSLSKKSGEYTFTSSYDNNYKCVFYLEGKSKEINSREKEIKEVYTSLMKYNYSLLNVNNNEENVYGISYLNSHLNEDIRIDKYSYNILKEAYTYSNIYPNYSIFAKPLYDFWNRLFTNKKFNLEYISLDPINNEDNNDLISTLKDYISDIEDINIEFKDNNVVRVNISASYLNLLKEYELEKSVVSLNILYDAYISSNLYNRLKESEYTNCYFLTSDTFFAINYNTRFSIVNAKNERFGFLEINNDEEVFISQYRLFNLLETDSSSFYLLEKDGNKYNRTKYLDISNGFPINEIKENIIVSDKKDLSIVELTLINNALLVGNKDYDIINMFSNNENELYLSKVLENRFVKSSDSYKYNFI